MRIGFSPGDTIEVIGIEPERNPLFPYDPYEGKRGTVVEVDTMNQVLWVDLDIGRTWFEVWEITKCEVPEDRSLAP